tara:strand:- start:1993 stop:2673 length:681 start_codon:yes stop_codon:yes gene_type:complete
MINYGALYNIKEKFQAVNRPDFFGFLRNGVDPEEVKEVLDSAEIECMSTRAGKAVDGWFVKKLGESEQRESRGHMPVRFSNHLTICDRLPYNVPAPLGLIYDGSPTDLLKEEDKMYAISENIPGTNLLKGIDKVKETSRLLGNIASHLKDLKKHNLYLMDFAPRDIVLGELNQPYFVDFEHMELGVYPEDIEELGKKQIAQARKDWEHCLSDEDMSYFVERLEGRK